MSQYVTHKGKKYGIGKYYFVDNTRYIGKLLGTSVSSKQPFKVDITHQGIVSVASLQEIIDVGVVESLPWHPEAGELYQFSNYPEYQNYVIRTFYKEPLLNLFEDDLGGLWHYCRPVPENLRKWGE